MVPLVRGKSWTTHASRNPMTIGGVIHVPGMARLGIALVSKHVVAAVVCNIQIELKGLGGTWVLNVKVEIVGEVVRAGRRRYPFPPQRVGVWSGAANPESSRVAGH